MAEDADRGLCCVDPNIGQRVAKNVPHRAHGKRPMIGLGEGEALATRVWAVQRQAYNDS